MRKMLCQDLKRKLMFLVILMCLISITSCSKALKSKSSLENETIIKANLTSREEELIKGTGLESYYAFDVITRNPDVNAVECWVDYYEKGKFKTKIGGLTSSVNVSKDSITTILFSTQASKSNKVEEKWTFSIISKNNFGYTSSTYSSMVTKVKPDIGSMSIGTQKNKILVDEPINLAVCVSNEKSPSTILAGVFYNNEALKQVITNDYVYILRCKFKKDIK